MSDAAFAPPVDLNLLARLAAHSEALKHFFVFTEEQWLSFLPRWPESRRHDLWLILREEEAMNLELKATEARKLQTAKTRFLQKVQKKGLLNFLNHD